MDDLSSWNWPAVNDVVDDTIQEELKVSDMEFTMEINARTRACSSPNLQHQRNPPLSAARYSHRRRHYNKP